MDPVQRGYQPVNFEHVVVELKRKTCPVETLQFRAVFDEKRETLFLREIDYAALGISIAKVPHSTQEVGNVDEGNQAAMVLGLLGK